MKNHVSSVLWKLGVRDRTRAALRGIELGLLTGGTPGPGSRPPAEHSDGPRPQAPR